MNRYPNLIPGKLYKKPDILYMYLILSSGKSINVPNDSILMYISKKIVNEIDRYKKPHARDVLTFSFKGNVGTVDFSVDSVFSEEMFKIKPIIESI